MGRTRRFRPCNSVPRADGRPLKLATVKSVTLPPLHKRCPQPLKPAAFVLATLLAAQGAGAQAQSAQASAASAASVVPAAPAWVAEITPLADAATRAAFADHAGLRVEVVPGALDPRLNLAPCQKVQPYLPAGHRAWGRTRIGLRCVSGPVAWNVTMPLTVKVYAPALVARQPLAAGTALGVEHLESAEVEWTASDSPVLTDLTPALGRTLARPLAPGQAVREADLRKRQWFAAGDPVKLLVTGPGFAISGEGTAMAPGLEGQLVRVRTESGRTVSGRATAERTVEVAL
jgi:flagella basal body P-ring formation protein FlgA